MNISGSEESIIINLYIVHGNIKEVSKLIGVPRRYVKEIILRECGPLYSKRAVCRAYLAVRNRCFVSVKDLEAMLGMKYHAALYVAKQLAKLVPTLRMVMLPRTVWKYRRMPIYYLVRDSDECYEEFAKMVESITGSKKVLEMIQWS